MSKSSLMILAPPKLELPAYKTSIRTSICYFLLSLLLLDLWSTGIVSQSQALLVLCIFTKMSMKTFPAVGEL